MSEEDVEWISKGKRRNVSSVVAVESTAGAADPSGRWADVDLRVARGEN